MIKQVLGAVIIILIVVSVAGITKINNLQDRLDTQMLSINLCHNELASIKNEINILAETKVNYSDMEQFDKLVEHLNEIIGTFEVIK